MIKVLNALLLTIFFVSSAAADCSKVAYDKITTACTAVHSQLPGQTTWVRSEGTFKYRPLSFPSISYMGTWSNGKATGTGILKKTDQYEYRGKLVDGVPNGPGIYYFSSGRTEVGNFSNGFLQGYGTINYSNGAVYKGELKNGRRSGEGTFIGYGGIKYTGAEWKNDDLYGFGRVDYVNGDFYEGQLDRTRWHGAGRLKQKGKIFEGIYNYESFDVKTEVVIVDSYFDWPTDYTYEGDHLNNLADGTGILKNLDGTIRFKGEFKNGVRHGEGTEFIFTGHPDFEIFASTNLADWESNINWAEGSKGFELNGRWERGQFREGDLLYPNGVVLKITEYNNQNITSEPELEQISGRVEAGYLIADGTWTVSRNLGVTVFSGQRWHWLNNGERFLGDIKDGKKHGMGVLKTSAYERHLKDDEIYIGSFKYDYKSGKAFVINSKTKQVKYCTFYYPEPPLHMPKKPRCISNSFLEWKLPIRESLSISTYLVPKLKIEFDKLNWHEKKEMGLQNWSFETFVQLLYSNYVFFDSIEINSKEAAVRLFEKLKDYETVLVRNLGFFDEILGHSTE